MAGNKNEIILNTLKVVGAVGILSVAIVAPNVLQSLKLFGLDSRSLARRKYYVNKTISNLLDRGYIKIINKGSKKFFKLTEKGQRELNNLELNNFQVKKPKKWDKKWRVVVFDIKELKRGDRDKLRNVLERVGFKKLQNSVWVFPYNCSSFIFLLKTNYSLGKDVLYMEVDNLENDKWLKKEFDI